MVLGSMINSGYPVSRLRVFLFGIGLIGGTVQPAIPQDGKQQDARAETTSNPTVELVHGVTSKLTSTEFLAAADKVYLRFMGYPELTGEYRVGPDESISIPVVGRIRIADLDSAQLENVLSAKIGQITRKEGYVTVEISAYKPIFVTGAIKRPGAIEWRPGLTVIQAIALTGGVGAELGATGEAGAGSFSQALERDVDNEKRVLATMARLTAERDGSPQITIPQRLVTLVGDAEANKLISHEADLLKSNRDALASKLAILEQGISDGKLEIGALREQATKFTEQLQLRRDYIRKLGSLRPDEEQLKLSDLEEKLANVQGNIAKSSVSVAEMQLTALGLKKDRRSAIQTDLDRLDKESSQLEIAIRALRNANGSSQSETKSIEYQIVRQKSDGSNTFAADEITLLKPGDVLSVALP
ncbi:MAG TPA: polysaccharide biosynthesis/export family protein [Roseiarcus sp.]|nr:polysaccharide biosynthesis/export family protein [Roseiarcus sp.]